MSFEEFPENIKKDVEDQSLEILDIIRDSVIVIGGWAVRALVGKIHARYTMDIDCVGDKKDWVKIETKLKSFGLNPIRYEWGLKIIKKYEPLVSVPDIKMIERMQLRVEVSGPRIRELRTHHFFEFDLKNYVEREIAFHNKPRKVLVKVPPLEHMAAVKLGLPVDYKNNFDAAVLLYLSDLDKVIDVITKNNDWKEMVLRRMPKMIGRIKDSSRLEHILMINTGLNIRDHIDKLKYIEKELLKKKE